MSSKPIDARASSECVGWEQGWGCHSAFVHPSWEIWNVGVVQELGDQLKWPFDVQMETLRPSDRKWEGTSERGWGLKGLQPSAVGSLPCSQLCASEPSTEPACGDPGKWVIIDRMNEWMNESERVSDSINIFLTAAWLPSDGDCDFTILLL